MNRLLLVLALIFVPLVSFAEDSPMSDWRFTSTVTLNGRVFWLMQYAQSWKEQDGYAIVSGRKIHYWLYNTYAYHDGDDDVIYNRIVPRWVEKMGYAIDYDNIKVYKPNTDLASSVKALMTQRDCNVSLSLVSYFEVVLDDSYLRIVPDEYVIINKYDKNENIYWSTIYPLCK